MTYFTIYDRTPWLNHRMKNGKEREKTKKRTGLTYFTIYEKTPWLNHRMKNGKEQKEAGFDLFYNL